MNIEDLKTLDPAYLSPLFGYAGYKLGFFELRNFFKLIFYYLKMSILKNNENLKYEVFFNSRCGHKVLCIKDKYGNTVILYEWIKPIKKLIAKFSQDELAVLLLKGIDLNSYLN